MDGQEIALYIFLGLMGLLIAWVIWLAIKEHKRMRVSLRGTRILVVYEQGNLAQIQGVSLDYGQVLTAFLHEAIQYRSGQIALNQLTATHVLKVGLSSSLTPHRGSYKFEFVGQYDMKSADGQHLIDAGNCAHDDEQSEYVEVHHRSGDSRRHGSHRTTERVRREPQWGTTSTGHKKGLEVLADKIVSRIDKSAAMRALVERIQTT
jgi:hypothetical protein